MRRRQFIALAGGATMWSMVGRAQSAAVRKVAILLAYPESDREVQGRVAAFKEELAKIGWSREENNLEVQERWTTDDLKRVEAAADELVAWRPDVILTSGSRVIPRVQQRTRTIPIVFVGTSDPVGQGLVKSLARPGGNTTGFSLLEFAGETSPVTGKMLETLLQVAPALKRVALIYNADNPANAFHRRSFEALAPKLGIVPATLSVRQPADIEQAILRFAKEQNGGALFPSDLTLLAHRELVARLMTRHRLPAIYSDRAFVSVGGLVSYSADRKEMFRRAASYVDRIFRGENPGDLPIQQPTIYQLVVNLTAAKAMGLEVQPALLARADEVIE